MLSSLCQLCSRVPAAVTTITMTTSGNNRQQDDRCHGDSGTRRSAEALVLSLAAGEDLVELLGDAYEGGSFRHLLDLAGADVCAGGAHAAEHVQHSGGDIAAVRNLHRLTLRRPGDSRQNVRESLSGRSIDKAPVSVRGADRRMVGRAVRCLQFYLHPTNHGRLVNAETVTVETGHGPR